MDGGSRGGGGRGRGSTGSGIGPYCRTLFDDDTTRTRIPYGAASLSTQHAMYYQRAQTKLRHVLYLWQLVIYGVLCAHRYGTVGNACAYRAVI